MQRRQFLGLLGGGLATVGVGKAIDNTLIGYGTITGTNLTQQDFVNVSSQSFPQPAQINTQSDTKIIHTDTQLTIETDSTHTYPYDTVITADDLPSNLPQEEREELATTHKDLIDLYTQNYTFDPQSVTEFFDTLSTKNPHPLTVGTLRGTNYQQVSPETVQEFTGVTPTDSQATVNALATALRQHTTYDVPRYLAGSVQDNILFGAVDLRDPFRSDVSFSNLPTNTNEEPIGMFCYEFTWRSIEALHSVPAYKQSPPVFAATVIDDRHKHVYTLLASIYRDTSGTLQIPITFIDYTHVVMYDDANAQGILGDGLNAYNDRHRATNIWWELPQ